MEPFPTVSPDPKLNRASARRLAELEPHSCALGMARRAATPAKFAAAWRAAAELSARVLSGTRESLSYSAPTRAAP